MNYTQLRRSSHDACLFHLVKDGGLVALFSLHVDDTLVPSRTHHMVAHKELEKRFAALTCEHNSFRHFGVIMTREENTKDVIPDQTQHLAKLKSIEHEPSR
jgi:hypothetical protein